MPGVQAGSAGRLAIELIAKIDGLQRDLDTAKRAVNSMSRDIGRDAKAANDNLSRMGQGAAQAAGDIQRLKAQLDPAWAAQQKFNQQQELGMRALKAGAIDRQQFIAHMRQINAELKGVDRPLQQVTTSVGAQRAGVQQLGFQLQDFAVQVAGGTSATRAFAQQFPQAIGAVTLMAGSTSKLGAFLGGPWGVAVATAAAVLVPFVASLFDGATAADAQNKAAQELSKAIDALAESVQNETRSQAANTQARIANAFAMRQQTAEALKLAKAELTRREATLRGAQIDSGMALNSSMTVEAETRANRATASIAAQRTEIEKLEAQINKTDASIRGLQGVLVQGRIAEAFDKNSAATGRYNRGLDKLNEGLRAGTISLDEYARRSFALKGTLEREEAAIAAAGKSKDRAAKAATKLSDAEKARLKELKELAAAQEKLQDQVDGYIEGLQKQLAEFGKTEPELRAMEKARMMEAAATDAQRAAIEKYFAAMEDKRLEKATADFNKMIVALYDEIELSGLIGKEREYRALQLEKEAKMAEWLAQGLTDLENKWLAYAAARMAGIENKSALERDKEAAEALNEQMDALLSSLGRMGGLGGLFGDIGNVLTSKNPIASMLGMGGVGTILGSVLGGKDITDKMGTAFTKSIRDTFPGLNEKLAGDIGGTLANVFQGAAIGGAVGGLLGGGKSGMFGATAGGALGQVAGEKLLSKGLESIAKGLGDFAGPLGSILGSVLGNVLGGLIGGTKRGGATIGAGGVSGTWGNSQSRIGAATDLGGGAVNALQQLASALGVPLGTFSSSVSVRKNDLRFDPTGSGISKTSKGAISFGQDEEALLKAVIADAIADGAFEGLSEGFKNYLTSGDVESRLQDVLNLKSVMNEAAQMRDPQGFALGELDKWRTSMLAIATATGEGMADIEYLYGERRKEILQSANDNSLEIERERQALLIQIAELEGRSTEALAMARQLEVEAADASLHPLMQRVYQLQDEATAAALAAQAAAEAEQAERDLTAARQAAAQAARSVYEKQVSIEAQIMTLQGNAAGALRVQRELELYAAEATIRPLLLHKYALEDQAAAAALAAEEAAKLAAEAEKVAEAARKAAEEAAALQKAIDDEIGGLNRRWLETIGDTAALRELDLGALLSDEARAIQQKIWDYTDALEAQKAAEEAATKAAEDYTRRLEDARNALSQAYERESGALQQTIDKFRDFAATIRDFRLGLQAVNDNTVAGSRSRFLDTARMAANGDANAVGGFSGSANAFLGTALNSARTRNEYQDQVAFVVRTALGVERSLGGQADSSQRQLQILTDHVQQYLPDMNESVLTVAEAIRNLQAIEAEQLPVVANTVAAGLDNVAAKIEVATAKAENAEAMSRTALEAILKSSQAIERKLGGVRVEGGAWTIRTDPDTPILTEAA